MSTDKPYDMIIVGAGFSGLTLAIALARQGFQVALIEAKAITAKQQQQAVDGRALALSIKSQQILTDLKIWPLLAPHAVAINSVLVSEQGSFGKLRFNAAQEHLDALGYVLPAPQLGAQLLACAQQQEHITWFSPASIENITQDAHTVSARLTHVAMPLSASLMIIAEGMQSLTRQQFSFNTFERDYEQVAIVANVSLNAGSDIAYQRFTTQGTLALLPLGQDRFTLVWSVPRAQQARWCDLSDEDFLQAMQVLFGTKLGPLYALGARQTYPLKAVFVEKAYDQRLLLMGNAAHTLHPIAAQGFNLTLRDIATLLDLLKTAPDLTKTSGVETLLAHYQALRLTDQKNMLRFTDQLVNVFSLPLTKKLRSIGLLALDNVPFLKRRLFSHLLGSE